MIPLNRHDPFPHTSGATQANTPKFETWIHLASPPRYSVLAKLSSPVNLFSSKPTKSSLAGSILRHKGDPKYLLSLCQSWAEFKPGCHCSCCYLKTKWVKKDKSPILCEDSEQHCFFWTLGVPVKETSGAWDYCYMVKQNLLISQLKRNWKKEKEINPSEKVATQRNSESSFPLFLKY